MRLDFREKKTLILGIQGSGKSHFARWLIGAFYNPLIYRVTDDFDNVNEQGKAPPTIFKPTDKYLDLDLFIQTAKRLGTNKKIDAVFFDELDLFLTDTRLGQGFMNELVLMHRHFNLAFVGISRRPQDIPGKVFESSHIIVNFALDAPLARKKLIDLHPKYADLLPLVKYEAHNFIVKELGQEPVLYAPLA